MIRRLLTALLLVLAPGVHAQRAFTSPQATLVAIEGVPACLDWCVIGVCYFLVPNCTPVGCFPTIETTARIQHNQPDAVITSWVGGPNPYVEAAALYDSVSILAGQATIGGLLNGWSIGLGGGNSTPKDSALQAPMFGDSAPNADQSRAGTGDQPEQQRHRNLRFHHTAAVGHPMTAATDQLVAGVGASIPGICPTEASPLSLYYHADADAVNWRTGTVDFFNPLYALQAITPGLEEVGLTPVNVYGNLMPRTGFVTQHSDYLAAAVTAERTAHIVTRIGEPRIYMPLFDPLLPADVEPPGPSEASGLPLDLQFFDGPWQQVMPVPDLTCSTFGREIALGKENNFGAYGWNYWQNYKCCLTRDGIYLGSTEVGAAACVLL